MRLTLMPRGHGLLPEHVRFAGLVSEAGPADGPVWVDVPEAVAGGVVDRLDAWLLWLLPHAFETQQDLVLDGPVDSELLRNAEELMAIWSRWRPDRRPIVVRAEVADRPAGPAGRGPERTGLFFTAGVDSFFTLFHHDATAREHPQSEERLIDDLIYVWGFDIPLAESAAFVVKRATLARIAAETGKTFVALATNLRETGVRQPWGAVMHGPALGGVGLLLGHRWNTVLLSSWFTHGDTDPWGSTAITDPLLSTSATRTRPHGAGHDRFEKLAHLARFPLVLDTLHVCWEERSAGNCGRCEKCFRTLVALDILGVRDRAVTFPREPLDLGRLAAVWKDRPLFVRMYEQLRAHAAAAGRDDIVAAIDACLARPRSSP
ncbi:MAG: hypothetical protein ACKOSQ_02805 [Planctomycetaceae bacterium]